jgi:hypothetical protein
MKKFLIALLVILIIIGVAMFVLVGKMDDIVKAAIEEEGSAALGSPVRVESVVTNLKEGSAILSNFSIANPAGYQAKNAVEVSSFSASVDYKNQTIENIEIDQPIINAEQKGQKNNFQDLLENMPATEEEEDVATEEDTTVITIKQLALRRATINLVTSELAVGAQQFELPDQSFVMEDFVLNNLSGTATEISDQVVKSLTAHVSLQVKAYLKKQLGELAKAKLLEEAKSKIAEQLEGKLDGKLDGEIGEKLKGLKFKFGKK